MLVVTSEFDQWTSHAGPQKDRLDILGLDRRGYLVLAELKRDTAPDTTEMQAVKYAALASKFTEARLAAAHAAFLSKRGTATSDAEALEQLQAYCSYQLTEETLSRPRIVLVAREFSPITTSSVIWLVSMGLLITLIRFQPYRAADGQVFITVSTLFPLPDVAELEVGPAAALAGPKEELPAVTWTSDDLARLAQMANATTLAALDMTSEKADAFVSLTDLIARAGRTRPQAKGELAGLTMIVKRRFGRSNWPFQASWAVGGDPQAFYSMTSQTAELWVTVRDAGAVTPAAEPAPLMDDPVGG